MRISRIVVAAFCGSCLAGNTGCSEVINPFRDDLPPPSIITTSSAETVREAQSSPALRHSDLAPSFVQTQNQGVAHWPLWWEDAIEDSGSNDGQFAWTWLDYFCVIYCPARQTVNTLALPISMVVDPPGSLRCSDGMVSEQSFGLRDHDAVRCGGVPVPPDIIEAYEQSNEIGAATAPPEDAS